MKNKLALLLSPRKTVLKESTLAFLGGFTIAASFVLLSDDIFYYRLFKNKDGFKGAFNYLRPREIFGTGAKATFIKHKIENNDPNETYKNYLQKKNQDIPLKQDEAISPEEKFIEAKLNETRLYQKYYNNNIYEEEK